MNSYVRRAFIALSILVMAASDLCAAPAPQVVTTTTGFSVPSFGFSVAKSAATRLAPAYADMSGMETPEFLVWCPPGATGRCDVVVTCYRGADASSRQQRYLAIESKVYTQGHERVSVAGQAGDLYVGAHGPGNQRAFISLVRGDVWLRLSCGRPTAQFPTALARLRAVAGALTFR